MNIDLNRDLILIYVKNFKIKLNDPMHDMKSPILTTLKFTFCYNFLSVMSGKAVFICYCTLKYNKIIELYGIKVNFDRICLINTIYLRPF